MFFFLFSGVFYSDGTPKKPLQELLDQDGCKKEDSIETYAQKNWIRPAGIERAHLAEKEKYVVNRDFILTKLRALGMMHRVMPSKKEYKYVVFHGAYVTTMEKRVQFFKLSKIRYKQVVFLTGQRYLDPQKESHFINLGFKTEYDAAKYLMKKYGFNHALIINAKGKNDKRPDTKDTVQAWHHTNPEPGTVLAISNNPYIQRQELTLKKLLNTKFEIETIGDQATSDIKISVLLDELARLIHVELN